MLLKHNRKISLQNSNRWINHLGIDGCQCRREFVNSRVLAICFKLKRMIVKTNGCFAFGIQGNKVKISV